MTIEAVRKCFLIGTDRDSQVHLQRLLEQDGYLVEAVGTAQEALTRTNWSEFWTVFLDRGLPEGTADVVLAWIRELAPELPIILVSADPERDGTFAALRHGVVDFLRKPIRSEMLCFTLARLTRLKDAEWRAVRAEQLAVLGQMAAVAAHEGRNALQRTLNYLALLAVGMENQPESQNLVLKARDAQNELRRLFDDLLRQAKPLRLQREPLDLRHVWQEAWGSLHSLRQEKSAQLHEKIDAVNLRWVGDRFRLEEVFRNLFENALAACPSPVCVEIRCSGTTWRGRSALRLVVRDNGPGLTPEQKRKVFEPFFTTKSEGTGLGLVVTRRIIETHGGEIRPGNGEGTGAEFVIVLPLDVPL